VNAAAAPHTLARVAAHEEGRFEGAGGTGIYWQSWRPPAVRAAVVLSHGASEHSGRYAWTAEQLAERGYATWAPDHRGHGHSEGTRAYVDRMDNVVADLDQVVGMAAEAHHDVPLFLLGHSMGGCVALAYTIEHHDKLDGLVLSAPLAALEAASPVERAVARALSLVAPKLGVVPIDSTGVSRDPEVVRDYDADPLNFHGKLPARTVAELGAEVDSFPDGAARITIPTLIMYSRSDPIVAPEGSEMLAERLGSDDVTLRNWDGLRHEILNEPERDQVIGEMLDWLDERSTDE
jgi:acylglycerol lipase